MEKDTVLLFYECDAWHSRDSMNLKGVFSGMFALEDYLAKMLENDEIDEDDITQLRRHGQTQGRQDNFMIETETLNPDYE